MKRIALMLLGCFILLTACSSSPSWHASMEQTPTYTKGQPSFIAIKITDEDGEPIKGLRVEADLEMKRMDHDLIEADLQEGAEGIYHGNLNLLMDGPWKSTIMMTDGNQSKEQTMTFDVNQTAAVSKDVVAIINGKEIVQEDIEFYTVINLLQIAMYREHDQQTYQGKDIEEAMKYWDTQEEAAQHKNTLLTQIIRLNAAALLAQEKGHQAMEMEITNEIENIKKIYSKSPAATKLITQYGEEKFWNKQRSQYQLIVLSSKTQKDVMELVKKANPTAEQKELNLLAQKKWEEILVSQISTLNIKII